MLQGLRGDGLHLVVDGGAHGQAAGEKLALAKVLRELAADFIGKVIARRQFRLKAFKVAILNGPQRLRDLAFIDGLADIAVFFHLAQNEIPALHQAFFAAHRMII